MWKKNRMQKLDDYDYDYDDHDHDHNGFETTINHEHHDPIRKTTSTTTGATTTSTNRKIKRNSNKNKNNQNKSQHWHQHQHQHQHQHYEYQYHHQERQIQDEIEIANNKFQGISLSSSNDNLNNNENIENINVNINTVKKEKGKEKKNDLIDEFQTKGIRVSRNNNTSNNKSKSDFNSRSRSKNISRPSPISSSRSTSKTSNYNSLEAHSFFQYPVTSQLESFTPILNSTPNLTPNSISTSTPIQQLQSASTHQNRDNYHYSTMSSRQSLSSAVSPSSSSPSPLSQSIRPLPRLSRGLPPFQHPSLSTSMSSLQLQSQSSPSISSPTSPSTPSSTQSCIWMNKPPRSNWNVSDNKLKPIPPLHPPIPPPNMIYINDSSPSIIACRISACLRKRSIIADYDDEAAVSTCWSKGDNGGGEGELILFTGAGAGIGMNSQKNMQAHNQTYAQSHHGANQVSHEEEYNPRDYGTSANALTGNNYGGGGGCVVFSIHLYRGDKLRGTDGGGTDTGRSGSNRSLMSPNSLSSRQRGNWSGIKSGVMSNSGSGSGLDHAFSDSVSFSSSGNTSSKKNVQPDFSHGIIVECMRIRGDTIQFHKDCRAIFASARADSDGLDDYRSPNSSLYHSPFGFDKLRIISSLKYDHQLFNKNSGDENEFNIDNDMGGEYELHSESEIRHPNLLQMKLKKTPSELTNSTFSGLERALDLLEKDRFDAQLLGVKSLALLTDERSSGLECSYMTSLCILGSRIRFSNSSAMNKNRSSRRGGSNGFGGRRYNERSDYNEEGNVDLHNNTVWTAEKLHHKVVSIAMGQFTSASSAKTNHNDDYGNECSGDFVDFSKPFNDQSHHSRSNHSTSKNKINNIESQYNSTIRGYMMHILTNALNNLIKNSHQFPLLPKPTCFEFMTKDFIEQISEDVVGATRPPMALLGTAHEATHAVKFLHLIASYSEEGFNAVHGANVCNGTRNRKRPIMELLDKAYDAGLSSHHVLKIEARIARNTLKGYAGEDHF